MLKQLFYVVLLFGLFFNLQKASAQKRTAADLQTVILEKGAKIILRGNSNAAVAYQWYKDSIRLQGEISKDIVIRDEGTFSVLTFNQEGCPSEMSDNVKVVFSENNNVDLSVGMQTSDSQIISGQWLNCQLSALNNSLIDAKGVLVTLKVTGKFIYQADNNNPLINYDDKTQTITWNLNELKHGSNEVLAFSIKPILPGQIDFLASIQGLQPDPNARNNSKLLMQQVRSLTIPNVFTPNGDGVDDTFIIPGLETFAESEIMIANRAGANVFASKNYKNNWSGENLPEGTYFYLLRIKDSDGLWQVYKSYITLLRSKLQ